MDKNLFSVLQTRYVKMHFVISFKENCILPRNKVSAIRGGIGEMLLCANCVRDRQCENCDFKTECVVQKVFYSEFEKKPPFVTVGGSIGYVIECENYKTDFKAGERLWFNILLFGKTIVHFNQILQAVKMLGETGVFSNSNVKYDLVEVRNMERMLVYDGEYLNMDAFVVHTLFDYILFCKSRFDALLEKNEAVIVFNTPATIKHNKEKLSEFQMEAIIAAIKRRIYMLGCFEGIDSDFLLFVSREELPRIVSQKQYVQGVRRYSNRKQEGMTMDGLKGWIHVTKLTEDMLSLLLIGELVHIGKNTSFGFGKYHLKDKEVM